MNFSVRLRQWLGVLPGEAIWLIAALTTAIAPYAAMAEPWLTPVWLALMAWFVHNVMRSRIPGRWSLIPATLAGGVVVLSNHGTLMGVEPGLSLLVVMTGLKLQEIHSVRDRLLVVYLGLFLIGGQFLIYDNVLAALHFTAATLFLCAVWVRIAAAAAGLSMRWAFKTASTIAAFAVPVAVALFLLFPRDIGPFWGVPGSGGENGVTGLSDRMDPGSVQQLAESEAIAFRAWFEGQVPGNRERYWRGPVLWENDGLQWERGLDLDADAVAQPLTGTGTRHTILLEPSGHRWLLALDRPLGSTDAALATDGVLSESEPVESRTRYQVASAAPEEASLEPAGGQLALSLPETGNPRTRALAQELRAAADSDRGVVEALAERLAEAEFRYTLNPPVHEGSDAVDQFLFETRTGFCEHFAGSAAFLLRAAGVPARVVMGYQGGQRNPVGEYLLVRQSDAHAWVEAYVDDAWRRFDPTAVAAPERVTGETIEDSAAAAEDGRGSLLRQAALTWDAINATWHQWVLAYNEGRQGRLLAYFGLEGLTRWHLLGLAVVITLAWLAAAAMFMRRRGASRDAAAGAFDRFRQKLAAVGIGSRIGEGPRAYGERAMAARPDEASQIRQIVELYVRLRYAQEPDPGGVEQLRRAVRAYRPHR